MTLRTLRLPMAALSAFALVACGGSVAPTPSQGGPAPVATSPTPPSSQPPPSVGPTPHPRDLSGSYELTFRAVNVDTTSHPQEVATPPSLSAIARLDLRARATDAYDAVLTPPFGEPVTLQATTTATGIALHGSASINGDTTPGSQTSDQWSDLTLDRTRTGDLAGTFTSSGNEWVSFGDYGWDSPMTGQGAIAADVHPPSFRVMTSTSYGPPDALLPWDPVIVRASEPIAASQLAFDLEGVHGALDATWSQKGADDPTTGWVGLVEASGVRRSYETSVGLVNVMSLGKMSDRAGNVATFGANVPYYSVPAAQAAHTFDNAVPTVSPWGDVAFLAPGDAECESGGCVRFTTKLGCSTARAGIAGRLITVTHAITARVRILVSDANGGSSPVPIPGSTVGNTLTLRAQGQSVTAGMLPLTKLSTPDGTYDWATAWTTLTLPAQSGADVGFSIQNETFGCGGPAMPNYDMAVLVDSVTAP